MKFDAGKAWSDMLNQWTHIAVIFDRKVGQAILYLNGHRQQEHTVSLAECSGSWGNNHPLHIGRLYGWKAFGSLRLFKMFNGVAQPSQIVALAMQDSFHHQSR